MQYRTPSIGRAKFSVSVGSEFSAMKKLVPRSCAVQNHTKLVKLLVGCCFAPVDILESHLLRNNVIREFASFVSQLSTHEGETKFALVFSDAGKKNAASKGRSERDTIESRVRIRVSIYLRALKEQCYL